MSAIPSQSPTPNPTSPSDDRGDSPLGTPRMEPSLTGDRLVASPRFCRGSPRPSAGELVIRYRRDVPADDQDAMDAATAHVRAHLSSVADPDDDPITRAGEVVIDIGPHPDGEPGLVSITGSLDAEPTAPYLRSDYRSDQDHPEIRFQPYEEPVAGRYADHSALARFRDGNRNRE